MSVALFCRVFFGMPYNVFKALEIQRNLTDRTVGYLTAYQDVTAEFTVLRRSTISYVNSYHQFHTYLILYLLQNCGKLQITLPCDTNSTVRS